MFSVILAAYFLLKLARNLSTMLRSGIFAYHKIVKLLSDDRYLIASC